MYIVAYDISDSKERNLVAKKIECYGERIQKSVWTCDVSSLKINKLREKLADLKINTGYIHIWQTQNEPLKIGAIELIPEIKFVHFL